MLTFVYEVVWQRKTGHPQDNSGCVYMQTAILSGLYHISQKSNFASCFLSVHGKLDCDLEKLSSVICNNKGIDQPAHRRSLISIVVICFLEEIYLDLLRVKLQFSSLPVYPRRLVRDSL